MKSMDVTFEPNDWARGQQTLDDLAAGLLVYEKGDLFRASLILAERNERILAMSDAWAQVMAGQLEGFPQTLKDQVQQKGVGGHLEHAKKAGPLVSLGQAATGSNGPPAATAYAATIYVVRDMLARNILVSASPTQPANMAAVPAIPAVIYLIGVLGTVAIAGGTWWGIERSHDQVRIAQHTATMAAEVDRYTKELEIKIAAGLPLPAPPALIERAAAAQQASPWLLVGLSAAGGALVAYGVYKGIQSPTVQRRLPVRQNPKRATAPRGDIHIKKARKTYKKIGTGTSKTSTPKRGRKPPARRRPNPYRTAPIAKAMKGAPVIVKPGRYDDNYPGIWYVVGSSGARDYKIARHPSDPWEVIIPRRRIKRATADQIRKNPAAKKKASRRKPATKVKRSTATTSTTRRKTKAGTVTKKTTTIKSNPRKKKTRKNPLRNGYSKATLVANVKQLRKEGYSEGMAAAIALKLARASWRQKHPRGGFPDHLQTIAERKGRKNPGGKVSAKRRPKASPSRSSKTKAPAKGKSARSRGRSSATTSAKASAARKKRASRAKTSSRRSASGKRTAKRGAKKTASKRAPKRAKR